MLGELLPLSASQTSSIQALLNTIGQNHLDHVRPLDELYVDVQYGMHEGTSQSAGFVAGAAALLLAAYRTAGINATGAMMKSPIMNGAQPLTQLKSRCKAGAGLPLRGNPHQLQCSFTKHCTHADCLLCRTHGQCTYNRVTRCLG